MNRIWMWFFLSCKRYLHRWSFLIILLLLPLGTFWIRESQKEEGTELRIAVCVKKDANTDSSEEKTEEIFDLKEVREGIEISERKGYSEGTEISERKGYSEGTEISERKGYSEGIDTPERTETLEGIETSEPTEALEQKLAKALVNRPAGEGLFRFYLCESEEQVRDEVASRRAECGYVIPTDLEKKLDRKKYKRSIRVYSAPSTMTAQLSSEVVFAAMIRLYDQKLFEQYMTEMLNKAQSPEPVKNMSPEWEPAVEAILPLYEKWTENGSTFHFTYESVDWQGQTLSQLPQASVFPVRGIMAVYLFIIGLYSAVTSLADERKHLFLAVPYGSRTGCRLAAMAAPVSLAGISGLAALYTGNASWRGAWELAALAIYTAAILLFSWLLRLLCPRESVICCLIPFFLVGSLIFCPVFLDIGKYLPEFAILEKFFLPSYYLSFFVS